MWDRILTDCHVATMLPMRGDPLGIVANASIAIQDGKIVRVGKRTELAGYRAAEIVPLGGAWVTPGLIDCHTHLVFGGHRAEEHAMRHAGASYEEIARAGGGIASTVAMTRAASVTDLLESGRRRLRALMAGGCTTVEIKSGYGLDTRAELRLLNAAKSLGSSEPVRVVGTLLALHALPPGKDREAFVAEAIDQMIPAVANAGLATSVDAFCEGIGFLPHEISALFEAAEHHGLRVRLHAEQLSNRGGAAAMADAGTVAVLLPGAFYALQETRKPPIDLLRTYGVPMAVATDCNPGTSPLLSPTLAINMACTLFGLTPEEALAGMTTNAARALGLEHEIGTIAPGKAADLAVWRIESPAELAYWMGLPGPERRIFAGRDA
jgi:imidazolonepropionase